MLTEEIGKFIKDVQLCFVATVHEDGTPNLSPKGSLDVYDERHLVFANIASPQMIKNIQRSPHIEINVIDIFQRRGYRFSGECKIMPKGTREYDFVADPLWTLLGDNIPVHEVIKVKVMNMQPILSPAYTYGENVTPEGLAVAWQKTYAERVEKKCSKSD